MTAPKPAILVQKIKTVFKCLHCGQDTSSPIDHIDLNVPDRDIGGWHCQGCGMENVLSIVNKTLMITPSLKKETKLISLLKSFEPLMSGDYIYIFIKTSSRSGKDGVVDSLDKINDDKEYWINQHTCPSNWLRHSISHDNDLDPHGVFQHVRTIIAPEAPHLLYTDNCRDVPDPDENYNTCWSFNEKVLRELFPEVTITSKTSIDQEYLH